MVIIKMLKVASMLLVILSSAQPAKSQNGNKETLTLLGKSNAAGSW